MKEAKDKGKQETIKKKPLGVYVHIPFCVKKCDYCDFLSFPADDATRQAYVDALCEEIRANKEGTTEYKVRTIYFGGGTPSVLSTDQLQQIFDTLREVFDVTGMETEEPQKETKGFFSRFGKKKEEIPKEKPEETPQMRLRKVQNGELCECTIEVNPGTVDAQKLSELYRMGFNRLSMGLQSADERELLMLGRIHSVKQFDEAFLAARKAGFCNISADLMSGLPGQTKETLTGSIKHLTELAPEHISVYSLQLEENTPFWKRYGENGPQKDEMLSEDEDRALYELTNGLLEQYGFHRYEISNYAKEGFESIHNSSYWIGVEYLGLGLGASSLLSNARFHNTSDMATYLKESKNLPEIREDIERLVEKERMEEFMFLGLRMTAGVSKEEFERRFGKKIETIYGAVLKKLTEEELIGEKEGRIYLTPRGIDVSNVVLADFLLDEFVRR